MVYENVFNYIQNRKSGLFSDCYMFENNENVDLSEDTTLQMTNVSEL